MTAREFVCIALGEIILAATFGIGVLVGMALSTRKDS